MTAPDLAALRERLENLAFALGDWAPLHAADLRAAIAAIRGLEAERNEARLEFARLLAVLDQSDWQSLSGKQVKRIRVVPSAIERIRALAQDPAP